jgi:hypothetical protein
MGFSSISNLLDVANAVVFSVCADEPNIYSLDPIPKERYQPVLIVPYVEDNPVVAHRVCKRKLTKNIVGREKFCPLHLINPRSQRLFSVGVALPELPKRFD